MTPPRKILIAEDDRMSRRILQHAFDEHEAFDELECELHLAEDGAQALEAFRRSPPDLIIADLFMPRVDGFALCQAIREHPHGMYVPIIVMSAVWKQPQLLDKLKNTYGVEFVEKPLDIDALVELVTTLLRRGA